MPEQSRVVIFEDYDIWLQIYERGLTEAGHTVVAVAKSIDESRQIVHRLEELGAQIAIVNGNLGVSHEDGDTIVKWLDAQAPNIKVIRVSAGNPRGGMVLLNKADFQVDVLVAIVTAIRLC